MITPAAAAAVDRRQRVMRVTRRTLSRGLLRQVATMKRHPAWSQVTTLRLSRVVENPSQG